MPYSPRPIRFLEVWEFPGWRMKAYSISQGRKTAREELVAAAKGTAQERLAASASATNHYGAGFVIVHDGKTSNFVCVDWWAEENELHHHVYVSPTDQPATLQYKTPTGLSACVWDLALIGFERGVWVEAILKAEGAPDVEAYLARRMNAEV